MLQIWLMREGNTLKENQDSIWCQTLLCLFGPGTEKSEFVLQLIIVVKRLLLLRLIYIICGSVRSCFVPTASTQTVKLC